MHQKMYARARSDLNHSVQDAPNNAEANNALAWLLATCPDNSIRNGEQALLYAHQACELSNWRNPDIIDTLAARTSGNRRLPIGRCMSNKP